MLGKLAPLVCGLLFGLGLVLSGMTDPARVKGFLDFGGHWDPTLMFVMGGAIVVHAPFVWWLRRRRQTLAGQLQLPTGRSLDGRLLVGATIFGLGWGLSGYCPGPALVALVSGAVAPVLFVAGMLLGSRLASSLDQQREGATDGPFDLAKTSHLPV